MEKRKFKPGDRVMHKAGNPNCIIEVIKYITEHHPLTGSVLSDRMVECVWYDNEKNRHTAIFDQRVLIKTKRPAGLYKV